jgi:glycosyltransferase involved in cell wall biosynthesis
MNGDLLLVHQAFASKDDPGGTRHFELAKRLVAQGRTFTVIASDVVYQTGKRTTPCKKLMTESTTDGVRILRAYTYASLHTSYVARVISFLSFTVTSVLVGLRAGRPDVVMGTTPNIFQAVSAWILSVLHRRPFLLEIRDLWPEFAIDIGLLRNPVLIKMARGLERFLYSRADHLLVNSPAYQDYLIAKGVEARKITLVPNGVDPCMFKPHDRGEKIRAQYGIDDKFVVTYAGALGMANDIDVLVEAAALIRDRRDVQILIVGDGKERTRLEAKVKSLELTNVEFTGPIPKSQMPAFLAASDACVAMLRNIKMFSTTYPNKVFDYMAAGRPTVLAIDGVIRKVVEAASGGIFVQPGDPKQLAAALIRLADDPQQARQMGNNAHSYVVEHFNRDDHAREFMNLVSRLAFASATK